MARIFINGVLRDMTVEEEMEHKQTEAVQPDTDLELRVAELEMQLKFAKILLGAEE